MRGGGDRGTGGRTGAPGDRSSRDPIASSASFTTPADCGRPSGERDKSAATRARSGSGTGKGEATGGGSRSKASALPASFGKGGRPDSSS